MKLLHDIFRLRLAGLHSALLRADATSPQFKVTVPAPLARPAADVDESDAPAPVRREPASFLKAPRHRRLTTHR